MTDKQDDLKKRERNAFGLPPEVRLEDLEKSLTAPIQPMSPLHSHDLARRLLALPDQAIEIVKGEGGGYYSTYTVHPGGPWMDAFGQVRLQIERHENGVAAS